MKKILIFTLFILGLFCAFSQNRKINLNDGGNINTEVPLSRTGLWDADVQTTRSRAFTISKTLQSKQSLAIGDIIELDLFNNKKYEAHINKIETDVNGTLSIRANITGYLMGYSIITTSPNGNSLVYVEIPELNEKYITRGNSVARSGNYLLELDPNQSEKSDCREVLLPEALISSNSGPEKYLNKTYSSSLGENDLAEINVMIVYTPAAKNWSAANEGEINNTIATTMSKSQNVLDNSKVGIKLNLVYSGEINYTESGSLGTDLNRITSIDDGFMDEVHKWRDQYNADLVVLFTQKGDYAGLAWLLNTTSGRPKNAFSVTVITSASSGYTPVHEMGHNMGMAHHKDQIGANNGLFGYSHGWKWGGNDSNVYCSVMTYPHGGSFNTDKRDAIRIPYFSNPEISYAGAPTGDAQKADGATTLRKIKHVIASYNKCPILLGLNAINITDNRAKLVWEPSGKAPGYTVWCKKSTDQYYYLFAKNITDAFLYLYDLEPDTQYEWIVTSSDYGINEGSYSTFSTKRMAGTDYNEKDKEGLRTILRKKVREGTLYNYELFGLTASDTLSWKTTEGWIDKINDTGSTSSDKRMAFSMGWTDDIPKRLYDIRIVTAGDDTYSNSTPVNLGGKIDLNLFDKLESFSSSPSYHTRAFFFPEALTAKNHPTLQSVEFGGITMGYLFDGLVSIDLSENKNLTFFRYIRASYIVNESNGEEEKLSVNLSNCPALETVELSKYEEIPSFLQDLNMSNSPVGYLTIHGFPTKVLDLSKLTHLNYLTLRENNLKYLDISKNTALTYLDLSDNDITSLDLSKNTELYDLRLTNISLSNLDLRNNTNLYSLNLTGITNLTNLNLSNNIKLYNLNLGYTDLSNTKLDLSNNIKLFDLNLRSCNLNHIDLSKNTALYFLDLAYNNLSNIDISTNRALNYLYLNNNNFSSLDLSKNGGFFNLQIDNNYFKLSQLPLKKSNWKAYRYYPQKSIDGGEIAAGEVLDLSPEYSINGKITSFSWYEGKTLLHTITDTGNGKFVIPQEFAGKSLICKMSNAEFPYLTVSYTIKVTDTKFNKLTKTLESDKITSVSSATLYPNPVKDILFIKGLELSKDNSVPAHVLDNSGRILKTIQVKPADPIQINVSDLAPNTYHLSIQGKSYTFIKI